MNKTKTKKEECRKAYLLTGESVGIVKNNKNLYIKVTSLQIIKFLSLNLPKKKTIDLHSIIKNLVNKY